MDAQQLLDELVQAARRLGVEVRTEPFETPATLAGGLCLVRGAHLVPDQRAPWWIASAPSRGPWAIWGARPSTWPRRHGS